MATESEHRGLANDAHSVYASIAGHVRPSSSNASARFIHDAASRFVATYTPTDDRVEPNAASDALHALAANWSALASGELDGETLFFNTPGLWVRLMSTWPMSDYGELLAARVTNSSLARGRILELGAGVGHTTALVRRLVATEATTIFATDISYAGDRRVDFDEPLPAELAGPFDLIYATNALHCSADPAAAIARSAAVLAPGGALVLAEGAPMPRPHEEWSLNGLFGLMRGWYDRKGFRPRTDWQEMMRSAGLVQIGADPHVVGTFDLGGVVFGFAPDEP